ncbi:MAG: flavodoxin [Ruminococcaceae bacterium]|nr:flavodoxin [Oscillospiraceae bacterium]
MKTIVVYKTKYGSTKKYAEWIGEELNCPVVEAKSVKAEDLAEYDAIVYGGGLYAEVINGVTLLTKNMEKLEGKRLAIYTTGITPLEYEEYYGKMVMEKNFKPEIRGKIKTFHFLGKMVLKELSPVHRTALKTLKKIMSSKENPTEMERLLVTLCDADGDFSDRESIKPLIEYIREG